MIGILGGILLVVRVADWGHTVAIDRKSPVVG